MPELTRSKLPGYGCAIVSVALATWLRWLLFPVLEIQVPFITYFLAVMVTAWYGGLRPALLAVLLGAVAANYYLIRPINSLAIADTAAVLAEVIFVFVGSAIAFLSEAMHRARLRAEETAHAHRKSLEWFSTTLNSIGDAVITTDTDGRVTLLNPVAQHLTGWSQEEARGKPLEIVFDIVNENTREKVENPVAKVLREGTVVGLANHTILMSRNGNENPIDDSGAPIRDEKGEVTGVVLVFRDIAERKRAEQDRVQFHEEIERQRTRMENIVATVPAVVWEAWGEPDQSKQRIDFVSKYVESLLGYTLEEWLSTPNFWLTIVHPDDKQRAAEEAAAIFRGGKGGTSQFRWMTKDGHAVWIEAQSIVILDEDGNPVGMRGLSVDIGERKKAEKNQRFLDEATALLSSSLDYETTLKSVAQLAVPHLADWCAVSIVEEGGEVRQLAVAHVDPAKLEMAREYQDRYPTDPDSPRGVPNVLRTGKSEFASEIPDSLLVEAARDQEHLKMIRELGLKSYMVIPLIARGRTLGAITFIAAESGHHYDQADLKFAEELAKRLALAVDNARLYREAREALRAREQTLELHRSVEARLDALVKASDTLIGSPRLSEVLPAILTLSNRLISADAYAVWRLQPATGEWGIVSAEGLSEAFRETKIYVKDFSEGMPPGAIIAEDVFEDPRLAGRRADHEMEGIRSLLAVPLKIRGVPTSTLVFYYRKPHAFTEMEARVGTALGNMASAAINVAELYEEQTRMRAEAEMANRMKDEFLATVSHELRTPLNAMVGWIQILRTGKLDEPSAARALETVERNTKAQTQLIEDLLDVSRIIAGKLRLEVRPVELSSIIEAAIEVIRPAAQAKDIRLQTVLDPGAGLVSGDPDRLQQVVWNFLSNAVKFTSKGGRIQVRLERVDSHVEIVVSDTGKGIEPDFLPYVFERFRQADSTLTRRHGGLGLGLAIVRHLVELHGGSVSVESQGEGLGATFRVTLPIMIAHDSGRLPTDDEQWKQTLPDSIMAFSGAPSLEGLRLLVVDDDSDARELMVIMLSQHGAEVTSVSSAAEALDALKSFTPDVLVSDIEMPGEDGYSLIRKVRALERDQDRQLPSIALTAHARVEDRVRALSSGFQSHVSKPVEAVELITVIASLSKGMRDEG